MSDFDYHGSGGGLNLEDPGVLTTDWTGLAEATAVWRAFKHTQIPDIYAVHPIFNGLQMSHREIKLKGPWAYGTCKYEGLGGGTVSGFAQPVYELLDATSEEPISTHPEFVNKIGGTAKNPKNGAIFERVEDGFRTNGFKKESTDKGYVFYKFNQVDANGSQNPYAGIESYLEASNVIWRKTVNLRAPISNITQVGKIDNPEGPAPRLNKPRNWLLVSITQSRRGSVYQTVTEWRASGRQGWNPDIYGD